jgi:hypothetical protein
MSLGNIFSWKRVYGDTVFILWCREGVVEALISNTMVVVRIIMGTTTTTIHCIY